MTVEAQDAIVETFRLVEKHGRTRPTNPQVFAIVRGMGHRFKDAEGKNLLAKFRDAPRRGPAEAPRPPRKMSVGAGIRPRTRPAAAGATRAGVVPIPNPNPIVLVSFDELEGDVAIYVANAAAENKTGKITAGRQAALRAELHAVLTQVGDREAFANGLRAANRAGAANANYVRKAAKPSNVTPLFASHGPPADEVYPVYGRDMWEGDEPGTWVYSDAWKARYGIPQERWAR